MRQKPTVIANWKLHPQNAADAEQLFLDVKEVAVKYRKVRTVIAPPFVYLTNLTDLYAGKQLCFGAQDVFWEQKGSYTGEISARQLADLGVSYAIVGHSERRALGETDAQTSAKARAAIKSGITAVVCVGEQTRDEDGAYLETLRTQVLRSIADVPPAKTGMLMIAYEPLWAIGKSADEAITAHELHETALFVRKVLSEQYGQQKGCAVPVLYGGSVESGNCKTLLHGGDIDGFLVGHASLKARTFTAILQTVNQS